MILQFCLALIILRWKRGFEICHALGEQVLAFLDYTNAGSEFVFGEAYEMHPIAFKVFV